jgi:GntR family transcriptional regulator
VTIDATDPRPAYQQVSDYVRDAISSGQFTPGDKLPSVRTLAEQYGVTPVTISRAIDQLMAEGLVDTRLGTGLFVRSKRPVILVSSYLTERADGSRATWTSEAERQGHNARQEITEVGTVPAPPDVAERLNLAPDAPTVVRRRILKIDGTPVQLSDSYYPASLAEGTELSQPRNLRGYTFGALERLGIKIERFRDDISLRMPTPNEARQLRLGRGIPVLRLIRTTYSADGQPVEVADQILAGDRYVLSYDVPAHPSTQTDPQ